MDCNDWIFTWNKIQIGTGENLILVSVNNLIEGNERKSGTNESGFGIGKRLDKFLFCYEI